MSKMMLVEISATRPIHHSRNFSPIEMSKGDKRSLCLDSAPQLGWSNSWQSASGSLHTYVIVMWQMQKKKHANTKTDTHTKCKARQWSDLGPAKKTIQLQNSDISPDEVHLWADKDVKDETFVSFGKSSIPGFGLWVNKSWAMYVNNWMKIHSHVFRGGL